MSDNKNLQKSNKNKNDEYYTLYEDIEQEMFYHKDRFNNKIIHLNCDDYRKSNFYKYFYNNFNKLNLKGLHATHLDLDGAGSFHCYYNGDKETVRRLSGNGSYDSQEVLDINKECDFIISNPPFSKYRHYIDTVFNSGKEYIIMGNYLSVFYKNTFHKFINEDLSFGYCNKPSKFLTPSGKHKGVNVGWFTNKRTNKIFYYSGVSVLDNDKIYSDCGNYLNIDKSSMIPDDYYGCMAVPCSFAHKVNRDQFVIIKKEEKLMVCGKHKFRRLIIKRK